jgi:hypothetical protein
MDLGVETRMPGDKSKRDVPAEKATAFEKEFKKHHGLSEEPLTAEEAFALRVYIEALEEAIGYYVQAGLVRQGQTNHLAKYKNETFQRGYGKLLGIGGTQDEEE